MIISDFAGSKPGIGVDEIYDGFAVGRLGIQVAVPCTSARQLALDLT